MNGKVFENWFETVLLPKLPKERNVIAVMGNGKYHSRLFETTLSMNMAKVDLIKFLVNRDINIPSPIPAKPVLLKKIIDRNVPKQYVIDSFTKKIGHDALQLPPYYCFKLIEMTESGLKFHVFQFNVYESQPLKVVELVRKVFDESISTEPWVNYTNHAVKEEGNFRMLDHARNNEIELFIIHF